MSVLVRKFWKFTNHILSTELFIVCVKGGKERQVRDGWRITEGMKTEGETEITSLNGY